MPSLAVPGAVLDHDVVEPPGGGAPGRAPQWVVQLHGLTSSRRRDARLGLDVARATTPERRLLRYDARGHGRSTGRREPGDYTWDRLAGDLLRLVEHCAPGEAVHGVGPSMGTGTLLHAAALAPERFRSLTLVVPPTAWASRRARSRTYAEQADLVARTGVRALVDAGAGQPVPPAAAAMPETGPDVDEALLPSVLRGAALADLPPREVVAGLRVPVLLLAWTDDPTHPLDTATALHDLLPGSSLRVARTPAEVGAWPALVREHVAACA